MHSQFNQHLIALRQQEIAANAAHAHLRIDALAAHGDGSSRREIRIRRRARRTAFATALVQPWRA